MKTYICHHTYPGKALNGSGVVIKKGETLEYDGEFLWYRLNGCPVLICAPRSLVGTKHFAPNDDGNGIERGAITYAIAYAERHNEKDGYRFDDRERAVISTLYKRFIRDDCETIIFNDYFFKAPIEELREMAKDLHIEIKKEEWAA